MRDVIPFLDFLWLGREQWVGHSHPLARFFIRCMGPIGIHARIRNAHILRIIQGIHLLPGSRVLDAGCGHAYASFWLARHHPDWEIWGIDTDIEIIEKNQQAARVLGLKNLHFMVGDVASLETATPFDLIFSIDVLEHLEDDIGALLNWRKAISKNGWLLLHLPLRHQLQKRIFPFFKQHIIVDHVRDEYDVEEIRAKLNHAGFTVDSITYGFGFLGELAFELNNLFWWRSRLRMLLAFLTFPLAILMGYMDLCSSLDRGNSLIIRARPSTI